MAFDIASELRAWRANVLNVLLAVTAVAAAPVIVFIIREAVLSPEQWPAALTFLAIYLFIAGLAVFRRLDYRLRVWGLLLLVYATGALAFARGGLAGDGRVYLLGLPVLAMILVGLRAGLAMAALSLLTFAVFAWTAQLGWMAEWLVRRDNPLLLMDWVIGGVAFLLTLVVIMAVQWYFGRFQEAVALENRRLYERSEGLRKFNENIVQSMEEGILLDDTAGCITFVNSKTAELLDYTAEELIGRHWRDFVAPEYMAKVEEETTKQSQGISSQYEAVLLTREGRRSPVIVSARPMFDDGRFTGVLSVFTDIGERKRTDEELRHLVEFGDFITTIAIYLINLPPEDIDSGVGHALQAIGELTNVDRGCVFLLSGDGMRINGTYEWCAPGIEPHVGARQSLPLQSPSWWMTKLRWFQTIHVPRVNDLSSEAGIEKEIWLPPAIRSVIVIPMVFGGSLIGFLSFSSQLAEKTWRKAEVNLLRTVTEILASALVRKQAEKELRESEEMERAILNATTESVMLLDGRGTVLALNQTAAQRFDKNVDELVGLNAEELTQDLTSPAVVKFGMEQIEGVIRSGEPVRFEDGRDGIFFDTNIYPVFDERGKVVRLAVFARDITARKRAEQQAARSNRLAAMGHVAATLAHEINNPLQAMRSNLELALDFDLEPEEQKGCLDVIRQEVERLTEITQRVLDFARPVGDTRYPTHVARLVERTLALLGKQLQQSRVQVTIDFPVDLPPAMVAPNRIVQVLLNIMLNAVEAMPGGGHVHITAHAEDDMVVLVLTNDGPPLPPGHIERIFDPFFTTKPNGTGMGLTISHSIIQQHDGAISVKNLEDGQGVAFTVMLPSPAQVRDRGQSHG